MEATTDRDGLHAATCRHPRWNIPILGGGLLRKALVRTVAVDVLHVFAEDVSQVPLAEDEDVIEAIPPHAPEEPLAGGVLPGRAVGRAQLRAPARRLHPGKHRVVLAIVVADQVAGLLPEGVAARSCWATQASVGWRVTPTWTTRRESSAMTKQA